MKAHTDTMEAGVKEAVENGGYRKLGNRSLDHMPERFYRSLCRLWREVAAAGRAVYDLPFPQTAGWIRVRKRENIRLADR